MYTLITDGGNRKAIPYGSFKIVDKYGEVIAHKQKVFGYGTSNSAEYFALIFALKEARRLGIRDIVVLTDSKLMQKQIMGEWQCNHDHLRVARKHARALLREFDSWKINKVSRNIIVAQLGH